MLLLWVSIGIKAKNPAVVQWRSDDRMVAYVRLCHGHACLFPAYRDRFSEETRAEVV